MGAKGQEGATNLSKCQRGYNGPLIQYPHFAEDKTEAQRETCPESYSKLAVARTPLRSASHLSPYSKSQALTLGILPLWEGKETGGGSKQGGDRKPVTEEQEVVVGVHPAAVCSHCVLITAASSFLASERPPCPDWQGSDRGA